MTVRTDVEFRTADGLLLRGWHFTPEGLGEGESAPLIVMSHGYSAVKEMLLEQFALKFAEAGLAVLLYDHRCFGASEGEPRQEINPWRQVEDMRDAITFAQRLPGTDPARIGIWGTSFSGGHVLAVASMDRRVKCVVSQAPFTSGFEMIVSSIRPDILANVIAPAQQADRYARMDGAPISYMTVVSEDPSKPAALGTMDSWAGFQALSANAPSWENRITLRSAENSMGYEPAARIAAIAPTPLLMVVAKDDWLTQTRVQLATYERAREPKKLALIEGGHFAPYTTEFVAASDAARDWFVEHLLG